MLRRMISILEDLLSVVENIGNYILFAAETVVNSVLSSFQLAVEAAVFLLPSLPETFAPPTILGWLNWFFPVGAVMSVATGLSLAYVSFLAVRWLFKKAGVL